MDRFILCCPNGLFRFKVCVLSPSDLTQVVKKLLMANHRNKFSLYNKGLLFKGSFVKKAVDLYAISPRLTVYLSDKNLFAVIC